MADHRLALRSEFGLPFAIALDATLGGGATPPAEFLKETKVDKFLTVLAEELQAEQGQGRSSSPAVASRPRSTRVVARINQAIGAVGTTLDYIEDPEPNRPTHLEAITALAKDIDGGQVETLIILGGNPVYDAPADLDFAGALGRVTTSIHLHEYRNETRRRRRGTCRARTSSRRGATPARWDGTITIAQPLIAPLYGGLSVIELLAVARRQREVGADLLRWSTRTSFTSRAPGGRTSTTASCRAARCRRPPSRSRRSRPRSSARASAARARAATATSRSRSRSRASPTTVASRTTRGCGRRPTS